MFYENLDKILKKKNLTLNKLAKGTGIAQSQTTKWKKGFLPGSEILIKVCKYLEISSDYLLDLNPEAPPILSDQEQELLEHFRQCARENRTAFYYWQMPERQKPNKKKNHQIQKT